MFDLTMQSTHFYLRFYGVGYIVKNNRDIERENQLPPLHGPLYPNSSMGVPYHTRPRRGGFNDQPPNEETLYQ